MSTGTQIERSHAMGRYSREDALRILHLRPRQIAAWERAGLIARLDVYGFEDLSQLRTLRDLRATRLSARSIVHSVAAMQRTSGMRNPLTEASSVRCGSRLAFRHAGGLIDPVSQQLAFDFDLGVSSSLRVVGEVAASSDPARELARATRVQEMFHQAVRLEEDAKTVSTAVALYEEILEMRPQHASAAINLGTIHYNRHDFFRAETMYRRATLADPEYALAFFDLGNVLDEMKRLEEAIEAYQRAIELVPAYADAHYNLALAYERKGERRRALRHWLMYVRLDPTGPWSIHAKGQARKILNTERLSIVSRRGQSVPIAG